MSLNGGPLAYDSTHTPQPLSLEEEAALAFTGCGITGFALAELPYETGDLPEAGSGNIMTYFVDRTVASGDAMHNTTLFVINDEGVWMLKRPQGHHRDEIADLSQAAREHRLVDLYEKSRVHVAEGRHDVPRELPFVAPFNKWSANLPGTTYLLPVAECTALYINILLSVFDEEFAYFVVDERNHFKPPGIDRFARSKGGHLHDEPREDRFATVGFLETWLSEFVAIEQGGMLQNLALMTQMLGLGGFPHFAAHPFIWFQTLGFRMQEIPFSRTIGAGPLTKRLMRAPGKDLPVPTAAGLKRDGETFIKPFCPPYYRNMEEAVLAFVAYKYEQGKGTFRDGAPLRAGKTGYECKPISRPTPTKPPPPRSPTAITCTSGTGASQRTADRFARCLPTKPTIWTRNSTTASTARKHSPIPSADTRTTGTIGGFDPAGRCLYD